MTGRGAGRALLAAGLAVWTLAAACGAGEPGRSAAREELDGTVTIPDLDRLRKAAISRWPSVASRATRLKLSRQIDILTAENLRLVRGASVRVAVEPDLEAWLVRYVPATRFYPQERALAAGILLQVDLMDEVLAVRDPPQAEAVRAARRLRRLRSEEDRIFFDKRDEVLHYCTDTLDDLQVLQSALAGVAPPPAPSLSGIRNWRDAERHLIARLESAAESARRIP